MKDYLSYLSTIAQVRADEAAQAEPNAAVLLSCDLFKAEARKQAAEHSRQFLVMSQPVED